MALRQHVDFSWVLVLKWGGSPRQDRTLGESDSFSGGQAGRNGVGKGSFPEERKSKASDFSRPVAKRVTETLRSGLHEKPSYQTEDGVS